MCYVQPCSILSPFLVPQSDLPEEGDDEGLPMYQIFYDFKPTDFDDPVLLFFEGKMR